MKKYFLLPLAAALVAACATVNKENLAKVNKVAVIGFTVDQLDNSANRKYMDKITSSQYSEELYQNTKKRITETVGWTVVDKEKVAKNQLVKSYYNKKDQMLDQLFKTAPLYVGQRRLEAAGVPQSYFVESLSASEMIALAKALNVNALVVLTANANKSVGMMMMAQSQQELDRENIDVHLSLRIFDGATGQKVANIDYQSGPETGSDKQYNGFSGSEVAIRSYKGYDDVLKRALSTLK